jgi:AcrR family transcriptional regulator
MELYGQRGFDETAVAEIARRAGLTERTFYRHFADKREVLFGGSSEMKAILERAVADAPKASTPIGVVAVSLEAVGALLQERRGREFARRRQDIIAANAELRERELIKLASWASAITGALWQGRPRTGSGPGRRGRHGCLQERVRALGRRNDSRDLRNLIRDSFEELTALTTQARRSASASAPQVMLDGRRRCSRSSAPHR